MKRILLACFLLTATCTVTFVHKAVAQSAPTPTTLADFTAKVNLLDTYIGAGNTTMAQSTWTQVHNMMLNVLAVSKYSIFTAITPSDKTAHISILDNQQNIYQVIWPLHFDLTTNRVALHNKLVDFGATIY